MTNQNCLIGIQCPKCRNESRFFIVSLIEAHVTDGGADMAASGLEWHDNSHTSCPECGLEGPLHHFKEKLQSEFPPDVTAKVASAILQELISMAHEYGVKYPLPQPAGPDRLADAAIEAYRAATAQGQPAGAV